MSSSIGGRSTAGWAEHPAPEIPPTFPDLPADDADNADPHKEKYLRQSA